MWFDNLAIPRDAPHLDNAYAFIDFMQRADVAAQNSNYLNYANGNAASVALIDATVRDDPSIYPSAEVRARLFPDLADTDEYSRILNRSWTRFVTGQ
jgi:putrescine transport system substrate-binding protein